MLGYIYEILNTVTQKRYIGLTIDLMRRGHDHYYALNNNCHHSNKLQQAGNEYHSEAFQFNILETTDESKLCEREVGGIEYYNSFYDGYNCTSGGESGYRTETATSVYVYNLDGIYITQYESIRQAQRELQCGSVEECCIGLYHQSYSKKDKCGYQFSTIYKDKLPAYTRNYSYNGKEKLVYQLDINGQILQVFESRTKASIAIKGNTKSSHLFQAIKQHKPYLGYYGCYAEDYNEDGIPDLSNKIIVFDDSDNILGYYDSGTAISQDLKIDIRLLRKIRNGYKSTKHPIHFKEKN